MRRVLRFLGLATALAAAAAGGRAAEPAPLDPYRPPAGDPAVLRIQGSATMETLVRAWAAAFRARGHGDVAFDIRLRGNGTGMPALYLGYADLAVFSRDLNTTDNDGFAHVLKRRPLRVELATGSLDVPRRSPALVLYVRADNPLASLTLVQVDAIFSAVRHRGAPAPILTWDQLGLRGDWAGRPIDLYADDSSSVAGAFLQHAALGDARIMNVGHLTEFRDQVAADGTLTEAAPQALGALEGDRFGLAVATEAYAGPGVRALALAAAPGKAAVGPSRASVVDRSYPLARSIFGCVDAGPGRPMNPRLRAFLLFILGPEGQALAEKPGGYLPLAPAAQAAAIACVRGAGRGD